MGRQAGQLSGMHVFKVRLGLGEIKGRDRDRETLKQT